MGGAAVVADAWAILALLRREGQASLVVRRLLRRAAGGSLRMLVSLVNFGEVYYRTVRLVGEAEAEERMALVRNLPLEIVGVREALVLDAARLKARYRISYADAFAVATARAERAPVLTGDPEILALPRDVVRVRRLVR